MIKDDIIKIIKNNPDSYTIIIKTRFENLYNDVNNNYVGKKFGEKLYRYIYNSDELGKCKNCKKNTKFKSINIGFSDYCCKKCSNCSTKIIRSETIKKNNKQNRDIYFEFKNCLVCGIPFESYKFRKQKCCSAKCSGIYVSSQPNRIEKIKKTKFSKYGNSTYVNPNKTKETCKFKYGVDNISKTQYFKELIKKELKIRYFNSLKNHKMTNDVVPLFTIEDYISTDRKNRYNFQCKKCNDIFDDNIDDGHIPRCLKCYPFASGYSKDEKEIVEYIKFLVGDNIVENDRVILNGLELDIYIPFKNIAIEYNGLYWHGEKNGGKHKNYHLNKTKLCNEKSIQLIHIFENEWIHNKELLKNKLKHILTKSNEKSIYARNCQIRNIKNTKDFLNRTHIQGNCASNIKLGAFFNDELVAVMTFGKRRVSLGKKTSMIGEFELLRFSTSKTVVGIGSKLLKFFITNYNPKKIITYANKRYSVGNLYEKLGFKKISESKPSYWYFIDGSNILHHRFSFRKDQLHKKLEIFDPSLSEWSNMKNNGYDRIWDCGNIVYEYLI